VLGDSAVQSDSGSPCNPDFCPSDFEVKRFSTIWIFLYLCMY